MPAHVLRARQIIRNQIEQMLMRRIVPAALILMILKTVVLSRI